MAATKLNFDTNISRSSVASKIHYCKLSDNQQILTQNVDKLYKTINTIIFDLDNTLIPTRSGDSKACRKVSEILEIKYGFTKEEASYVTQNFLKSFRRCPDNVEISLDSWRMHLWREALPPKYKQLAETIYPMWLDMRYRYLAIPEEYIEMLIRFQQENYQLALITNGPSKAQWEKIRKLHVQLHFECVLVSSDLPWEKPDPNIFYAACKYLNVKPEECAMIGDKLETDIKGGYLAGLGATFWIPLTPEAVDCLDRDIDHKPSHILRSLLDLYKYFDINVHQRGIMKQVPVYNSQSNQYLINNETDNSSENSSDSIN